MLFRSLQALEIKFKNEKEFNILKGQIKDITDRKFPDCLLNSQDFKKAKEKFDKKCSELEKLDQDLNSQKERLEEFKDMTSELKKSGINVKGMVKNIEKSESFLKAVGNGGNPQKMQQVVNKITENNNEIQEDLTEICEKDKTSKGKSRLKRLKDWSKKFSKKLKIEKNKSKSKK